MLGLLRSTTVIVHRVAVRDKSTREVEARSSGRLDFQENCDAALCSSGIGTLSAPVAQRSRRSETTDRTELPDCTGCTYTRPLSHSRQKHNDVVSLLLLSHMILSQFKLARVYFCFLMLALLGPRGCTPFPQPHGCVELPILCQTRACKRRALIAVHHIMNITNFAILIYRPHTVAQTACQVPVQGLPQLYISPLTHRATKRSLNSQSLSSAAWSYAHGA